MKTLTTILILFCGLTHLSFAQVGEPVDILYLKNGSMIRGTIIELVPDKTVKIRTSDGSVFVYKMDEVEKIEKAANVLPPESVRSIKNNPYRIHRQIAGIGLGSAMAATLVGSLAMDDDYFATTVLPIVGPWVTMIRIENDPYSGYLPGGRPLLIASGLVQGGLLVYYVVSLVKEKSYNPTMAVQIYPNQKGFSLTYRF